MSILGTPEEESAAIRMKFPTKVPVSKIEKKIILKRNNKNNVFRRSGEERCKMRLTETKFLMNDT